MGLGLAGDVLGWLDAQWRWILGDRFPSSQLPYRFTEPDLGTGELGCWKFAGSLTACILVIACERGAGIGVALHGERAEAARNP